MRIVKCYDCGRHYNYDEDGFCPRCGAFNQPAPIARVGADGSIVRVDGLSERGHTGSFTHKEYHEETKERKKSGLDKGVDRIPMQKAAGELKRAFKAAPTPRPAGKTLASGSKKQADKGVGIVIAIIIWFLSLVFGFFL